MRTRDDGYAVNACVDPPSTTQLITGSRSTSLSLNITLACSVAHLHPTREDICNRGKGDTTNHSRVVHKAFRGKIMGCGRGMVLWVPALNSSLRMCSRLSNDYLQRD